MQRPSDLVKMGVITGAHGIRGQVKLRSSSEDLAACDTLSDAAGKKQFKISLRGGTPPNFIASIEGINDRNAAELLRGTELYAPAGALPERKENSWYYSELIGLAARLASGSHYGKIVAVHNFGAGDIIEIELADGKTEMLPLADTFVGEINTAQGYMVISPPDYLEANP
jgi:16S rRNA processing protein RimM